MFKTWWFRQNSLQLEIFSSCGFLSFSLSWLPLYLTGDLLFQFLLLSVMCTVACSMAHSWVPSSPLSERSYSIPGLKSTNKLMIPDLHSQPVISTPDISTWRSDGDVTLKMALRKPLIPLLLPKPVLPAVLPISVNGSLFYTNGSKQSTSLIPVFSLKLHIQPISKFYPIKLLNTS